MCPHCAEAAGIDEKSLRPGARFGKEGNDLVDVLIAADKVVDFSHQTQSILAITQAFTKKGKMRSIW